MAVTAKSVVIPILVDPAGAEAGSARAARALEKAANQMVVSAGKAEGSFKNLGFSLSNLSAPSAAAARATSQIVTNSDRAAAASRNLSFQLSDIGTQFAGGASPFLIIAQQGPQVIDALDGIKASGAAVGAVLRTIALPGALALISALYGLYKAYTDGADAAQGKKKATDDLKEAMDRLNNSSASLSRTTAIGIQNDIAAATALRGREIQTRKQIQAELDLARVRLSAAQESEKGNGSLGIPGFGAASRGAQIADLTKQIAEQNGKIADAEKAIRSGIGQLTLRQVAAAADKATAATTKYGDAIDALGRKHDAGLISDEDFRKQATAITAARGKALQSISDGKKAQSAANATAKREADELAKLWEKVEIASRSAGLELAKISKGITLRDLGLTDFLPPNKSRDKTFREIVDTADAEQKARGEAAERADADLRHKQEDNIRSLADLYESAFTGAGGNIAETFKRELLAAVAVALARFTLTGKFDLGSSSGLLGSITSLFKTTSKTPSAKAGGGNAPPNSLIRVNEQGTEFLRVGGQGGEIIPLGQTRAAMGGGTTVYQPIHADFTGAVVTQDLIDSFVAIADSAAVRGASGGSQMAQAALARSAKYRLG